MKRLTFPSALALVAVSCGGNDSGEGPVSREQLLKPETCKECHEQHYKEWSGSMHAYASDDPVFRAMNELGQEETDNELGDFCVSCHAPMAVVEGATEDGTNLDEVPDHLQGITCYFCHNVESVEGTHNNPLIEGLANDQTMRGNFADPVPNPVHRSKYSPLTDSNDDRSSDLCGPCHDIVVPKKFSGAEEDVHLERTFAEFEESLFSHGRGALSCNNCHMNSLGGVAADFEGVKTRNRHQHTFPAVDVAITEFPQREAQFEAVQAFLDTSLRVETCVNQTGGIKVLLDNIAAAHNFPSGASQDRRVWVEVIAYDEQDNVMYSSGVVGDEEPVVELDDPDLWLLRDEAFDTEGHPAHMFWNVAEVEPKTIPRPVTTDPAAEGYHVEQVEHLYRESEGIGLPARVTVRVRVRPIGLDVLDELVPDTGSGHLDPKFRNAAPTFNLLPNRGKDELGDTVTLQWTPDAFDEGRTDSVFGVPAGCVQTGKQVR